MSPWIPVLADAWNHSRSVKVTLRNGEHYGGHIKHQVKDDTELLVLQDYSKASYNRPGPSTVLISEIVAVGDGPQQYRGF
jgi:small nuclear ribonucleoprotein (snRNP)-like protein